MVHDVYDVDKHKIGKTAKCERQNENRRYENSISSVSSQEVWQRAFNPYIAGSNPVWRICPIRLMAGWLTLNQ